MAAATKAPQAAPMPEKKRKGEGKMHMLYSIEMVNALRRLHIQLKRNPALIGEIPGVLRNTDVVVYNITDIYHDLLSWYRMKYDVPDLPFEAIRLPTFVPPGEASGTHHAKGGVASKRAEPAMEIDAQYFNPAVLAQRKKPFEWAPKPPPEKQDLPTLNLKEVVLNALKQSVTKPKRVIVNQIPTISRLPPVR